jgi:hypothetical protein
MGELSREKKQNPPLPVDFFICFSRSQEYADWMDTHHQTHFTNFQKISLFKG